MNHQNQNQPITPEEAREHLAWPEGKDHPKVREGSGKTWFEVQAGESHPYWNGVDAPYEDAVVYAIARAAIATVAEMHEEWSVSLPDDQLVGAGWGTYDTALEDMNAWRRDGYDARLVRRYVTKAMEA